MSFIQVSPASIPVSVRAMVRALRRFAIEVLIALWMFSFSLGTYLTGSESPRLPLFLFGSLAGGVAVVLVAIARRPVRAGLPDLLVAGILVLNVAIAGSYVANVQSYDLFFMLGNMLSSWLMFLALIAIVTRVDLDFRVLLIIHCILGTVLLPFIWARSHMVWGRLITTNLTPNFVGMIALACLMGALGARRTTCAVVLSLLPAYTVWAFQSRAAVLTALVAVAIIAVIRLRRVRFGMLALLVFTLIAAAGILTASTLPDGPFAKVIGFITNDLFKLNDKYRGFSSGASGRSDIWKAAFELWIEHPLVGVGFKGHPKWMPDQLVAHNAYLGILADIGLLGLSGYLLIIGVAFYSLFKRGDNLPGYAQRAAMMLSYLLYGCFEVRQFNFGNAYSLVFLLMAFDTSKQYFRHGHPVGGASNGASSVPAKMWVSPVGLRAAPTAMSAANGSGEDR